MIRSERNGSNQGRENNCDLGFWRERDEEVGFVRKRGIAENEGRREICSDRYGGNVREGGYSEVRYTRG